MSDEQLGAIDIIFFDIDDTFSGGNGQHRILSEAYDALWRLQRAGIRVVPVTGRPAGWCDMIARMWPVTAVVGENGAFYCRVETPKHGGPSRFVKTYLESQAVREKNAKRLKLLHKSLKKKFKGVQTASDQGYREFDLAIDCFEDVKPWPKKRVDDLLAYCRSKGAIAKLSSIHVNTWFGKYDKLSCVKLVLKKLSAQRVFENSKNVVYIGDSHNDEPFFEKFGLSVGVANVERFLESMQYHPTYITAQASGLGFTEFANRVIAARNAK